MSYCRFSSDNFQSDVYCYATDGGYVVQVAENRHKDPGATMRALSSERPTWDPYANLERIGLPNDGQRIHCDTPGQTADCLEELRETGYRVPQRAIDALREEAVS